MKVRYWRILGMALATRSKSSVVTIRLLVVAVLAVLVPAVAHANGCSFQDTPSCVAIVNTDGNAGGNATTGMTLTGSSVASIKGSMPSGDHASLSFRTGALTSGTLAGGGMFAGGGSIAITGTYGGITGGTIFSGTFSGPVSWVFNGVNSLGQYQYVLTGDVSGTWDVHGSSATSGSIVQIDFTSTTPFTGKAGQLSDTGGITQLFGLPPGAVVPEPSSLSLVGSGLLGLAFAVRRKLKGSQDQTSQGL